MIMTSCHTHSRKRKSFIHAFLLLCFIVLLYLPVALFDILLNDDVYFNACINDDCIKILGDSHSSLCYFQKSLIFIHDILSV